MTDELNTEIGSVTHTIDVRKNANYKAVEDDQNGKMIMLFRDQPYAKKLRKNMQGNKSV